MRVVSTFPSATETVCALGFADTLVGVSHRCSWPPEVRHLPAVTRSVLTGRESPAEVSRKIQARRQNGLPIYELDKALLAVLNPDLVIGQEVCATCALPAERAEAAAEALERPARSVTLNARTLGDILANIRRVADVLGAPARGERLVRRIQERLAAVADAVSKTPRPRVFAVEWIEPLKSSGAWIPDLIEAAGGSPVISSSGERVRRVAWDEVAAAAPEVLLVMPCGRSLARIGAEVDRLTREPVWNRLPAVRSGRVYLIDGRICSRHGPRIADAVELLAHVIHPDRCPAPGEETAALATRWRPPGGSAGRR